MRKWLNGLVLFIGLSAHAQIVDTAGLRSYINSHIIPNGKGAITAQQLNVILNGYLSLWPNDGAISSELALKPDSIRKKAGTDSVFMYYVGLPYFAFVASEIKAGDGLQRNGDTLKIGGSVKNDDTIDLGTYQKRLWIKHSDAYADNPFLIIGQMNDNPNGFSPSVIISDSAEYNGENSTFLSMSTGDLPKPNGFLFLNYQNALDSIIPQLRVANPTYSCSIMDLEMSGHAVGRSTAGLVYNFFDLDTGNALQHANLVEWHNGQFAVGSTFFQIDSEYNLMIGPAGDTIAPGFAYLAYARPLGQLDIKDNHNSLGIGVNQEAAEEQNIFAGKVIIGTNIGDTAAFQVTRGDAVIYGAFKAKGSFATNYTAVSAAYTVGASDHTIDCVSGTFSVTLPTAVGITGKEYTLINSGNGVITAVMTSGQTINGTASYVLSTQYKTITVQSTGTNWIIISSN